MSDLREANDRKYVEKVPHFNSVLNALENPELTPILTRMIEAAALPLTAIEETFAADSTGFSTGRFERWFDHKWGKERFRHEWVKVHVMVGTRTNVVTAVQVGNMADTAMLPALLDTTKKNFAVSEVSADKGYLSYENARYIADSGATPYIAFKINSGPGDSRKEGKAKTKAWSQMFHMFMYRRDEFLQHYHRRSNVETSFSMMKRKFGDSLRSKTDTAMTNEALCKVLCHNLVVLIHEIHELGIDAAFCSLAR